MASYTVNWQGPRVLEFFRGRMQARVRASADLVASHAQSLVSIPYPPASSPGNPPHRRTGLLRSSIRAEVVRGGFGFGRFYGRVIADVPYASFLERGTRRMAARPFLGRALAEMMPQVLSMMKGR